MKLLRNILLLSLSHILCASPLSAQSLVLRHGQPISYAVEGREQQVVGSALDMLQRDARQVLGSNLKPVAKSKANIIVRTLSERDSDPMASHTDAFRLEMRGGQLFIIGAGANGTAYGLLEVSRLMGVSPWVWWADSRPARKDSVVIADGFADEQRPAVRWRGIFINDEDYGFTPWAGLTMEGEKKKIGPKTHQQVFELLLRLRANLFWPAMHRCSTPFYTVAGNREMAERYGITIGTSHCEPMMRNTNGEWNEKKRGAYDYVKNPEGVKAFWEERVKETAKSPAMYTLGMRGIHDTGMVGAKTLEEQVSVTQQIIDDQRKMLSRYVNKDATRVPQAFIPYKEVLDIYRAGLQVPDDVTLIWTDDNYGYLRQYPTAEERRRKGGNGMYYHISYTGRPHSYLWLATTSPELMQTEMERAYRNGIQQLWVVNVGDIKPGEFLTEYYLDMAWSEAVMMNRDASAYKLQWLTREFGADVAPRLVALYDDYYRLSWEAKPEYLDHWRNEEPDKDYRQVRDMPWSDAKIQSRLKEIDRMQEQLDAIRPMIKSDDESHFFELADYPLQSFIAVNRKMLLAQLARHGRAKWQDALDADNQITSLIARYDRLENGKWRHMLGKRHKPQSFFSPLDTTMRSFPQPEPRYRQWVITASKGRYGSESYVIPRLGYSQQTLSLAQGDTFEAVIPAYESQSQEVVLSFVPNHPCGADRLEVLVEIDGERPTYLHYETHHRSEEWKQNVLANRTERILTLPPSAKSRRLRITATTPAVLLDQIVVRGDRPLF